MDVKFKWLIALSLLLLGLFVWRGCRVRIETYDSQSGPTYPQIVVVLLSPTPVAPTPPSVTVTPSPTPGTPMPTAAITITLSPTSVTPTQTVTSTATQSPTFVMPTQTAATTATRSTTPAASHLSVVGGPWRVSVASDGTQANGPSQAPRTSADGRTIVFASDATNLVPDDTNGARDAFVHDRQTGATIRVSVASDGTEGNSDSGYIGDRASTSPTISAGGRYVTFESQASNLVPDDTNASIDIFVHDLQTGTTERDSVASDGTQANGRSFNPALSADGRYIAFESTASNLVVGDANESSDIFVHDRVTGQTELVSISSAGALGNSSSGWPSISGDGRFVAFHSFAGNLVPGDTNDFKDVFIHDRQTGETSRVSLTSDGDQAEGGDSSGPIFSPDGRWIAFASRATNLVSGDTNGDEDVFVHDRTTGEIFHISVASDGTRANDMANVPVISSDGRFLGRLTCCKRPFCDFQLLGRQPGIW